MTPIVHRLEIIATGEKNPDSQGCEIWFRGLCDERGAEVPREQIKFDEGWAEREDKDGAVLVADGRRRATLSWSGAVQGKLNLLLGSHEWSGLARVRWDDTEQQLDLYSQGCVRCIELTPADAEDAGAVRLSQPPARHKLHGESVVVGQSISIWRLLNPVLTGMSLWHYRNLIKQFTVREFTGRYKGSMLGVFWSLLVPLMLLGVYTFVFSVIFQMKWSGSTSNSRADLALRMFCALIIFNIFSECVNRAPVLVINVPNYVKKVVFPLQILPVSVLAASVLQGLLNVVILFIFELVFLQQLPPAQVVFFPLVMLPLILLTTGLSWFLSSLGVLVRDTAHILAVIVQILFYLTPIFYPAEVVPASFRWAMIINPLTPIVEGARSTLYVGTAMNWHWLAGVTLASLVVMQLGYAWFMKTKRGFADVL